MSKYKRIATQFKDRECLLEALKRVGIPFEVAPQGETLLLDGFSRSDKRYAEIVIRKRHIVSNGRQALGDLGYKWDPNAGAFTTIVDDWGNRTAEVERKIKQQYAVSKVVKEARRKGLRVVQQRSEQGQIRLVLQGYAR